MELSEMEIGQNVFERPDGSRRVCMKFPETGRTKPDFAKEADMNRIMAKFKKAKSVNEFVQLSDITSVRRVGYGDFTTGQDFADSARAIYEAEKSFNDLPSKVRRRFHHDPAEFLAFLTVDSLKDEKNLDEAIALGLVDPKVKKAVASPPVVVPPAVPPAVPPVKA